MRFFKFFYTALKYAWHRHNLLRTIFFFTVINDLRGIFLLSYCYSLHERFFFLRPQYGFVGQLL